MIRQESLYIELQSGAAEKERLHVRRIFAVGEDGAEVAPSGPPVLLLHGALENGRIFYTESGKGFGPYLASRGFEAYVCDLRGRGLSTPSISRKSRYGQLEAITEDIPAFVELVRLRRGDVPQLWGAHSWGGVLLLSHLARSPETRSLFGGAVFFGTKRSVHVQNIEKRVKIDFFWLRAARAIARTWGYLPAKQLRVGADNETNLSHLESKLWVQPGPWIDSRDGFDYEKALRGVELPPMLFLAGQNDRSLGHPQDVRALIRELGPQEVEFRLLGKRTGALHDYGHIDMLTHPDAERDHFPEAVKFLKGALRR